MNHKTNEPVAGTEFLPRKWEEFCRKGKMPRRWQRASVRATGDPYKELTGYYSGLPLDPTLPHTDAMYPSHDHLAGREDHSKAVLETRLVNDMKSILTEDEFWGMIEHLYAVGLEKKKVSNKLQKLKKGWKPAGDFKNLAKLDSQVGQG